jgi:hypothetical protein
MGIDQLPPDKSERCAPALSAGYRASMDEATKVSTCAAIVVPG